MHLLFIDLLMFQQQYCRVHCIIWAELFVLLSLWFACACTQWCGSRESCLPIVPTSPECAYGWNWLCRTSWSPAGWRLVHGQKLNVMLLWSFLTKFTYSRRKSDISQYFAVMNWFRHIKRMKRLVMLCDDIHSMGLLFVDGFEYMPIDSRLW